MSQLPYEYINHIAIRGTGTVLAHCKTCKQTREHFKGVRVLQGSVSVQCSHCLRTNGRIIPEPVSN